MGLLLPAALGFLAIIPGIIALYFLKLRRHEREVSSTWLWRRLLRDRQANSLWQRLRISPLLLLQLLAALALILAASHPFTTVKASSSANLVIILDATGAMQATDIKPDRFTAAKEQARQLIDGLPPRGRLSLILLTRSPEILLAGSEERSAAREALDAAKPTAGDGDLGQAMALANSLLAGQPDGQIVVIGSGHYRGMGDIQPATVPVRYQPVGTATPNLAVGTFSARLVEGKQMALTQVTNFGPAVANATAEFWADGRLVTVASQSLQPEESRVFAFNVPEGARVLELRLPAPDGLDLDNRAWTLAAGQQSSRILLVSEGNPFLLRALNLIPGARVSVTAQKDFTPGDYDLYVFDQFQPPSGLPSGRLLLIDPPGAAAPASEGAAVPAPLPTRGEERFVGAVMPAAGDPLLKYVDAGEVHINLAHLYQPGPDARVLWTGKTEQGEIPLIWTEGNDRAVFAFALQQSDLPLRVAFPILIQNLAGWLLPPAPVDTPSVQPGESVQLRPWPAATHLTVRLPDGSAQDWSLEPSTAAPFLETRMPGLYQVTQTVGGGTRESRFAVNLFSGLVSNLTPATELNVPVLPEAHPVATRAPLDLWRWLGWAALALIGLEWWVYRHGY